MLPLLARPQSLGVDLGALLVSMMLEELQLTASIVFSLIAGAELANLGRFRESLGRFAALIFPEHSLFFQLSHVT